MLMLRQMLIRSSGAAGRAKISFVTPPQRQLFNRSPQPPPTSAKRTSAISFTAPLRQLFSRSPTEAQRTKISFTAQRYANRRVCDPTADRSLIGIYKNLLITQPILVQAVQSGLLMAIGDLIAQTFFEGTPFLKVDFIRTGKFFALGLCFVGPVARAWYGLLARGVSHPQLMVRTLKKVAWDQCIFAPVFLAQIVSIISYMQTQDVEKIKKKLRDEYLDILLANYYVWPLVQFVNFFLVPLSYQVLLTQVVAVSWNVYISWKTSLNKKSAELDPKKLKKK